MVVALVSLTSMRFLTENRLRDLHDDVAVPEETSAEPLAA